MTLEVKVDHIPLTVDQHGVARVGGTRVTLDTVVSAFKGGATAELIVDQYPTLKLADVYFIIGFYLSHSEDVYEYLERGVEEADRVRRKIDAAGYQAGARASLMSRWARQTWAVDAGRSPCSSIPTTRAGHL